MLYITVVLYITFPFTQTILAEGQPTRGTVQRGHQHLGHSIYVLGGRVHSGRGGQMFDRCPRPHQGRLRTSR